MILFSLLGVRAPAPLGGIAGARTTLGARTLLVVVVPVCVRSLLLLSTLGRCTSILLLLFTLGRCTTSDTLGRVAVVVACLVGCNKSDNTPIALLILLSVNGMSRFRFAFIAAVNSSSAVVALSAAAFAGNSNFDGMNTYVSGRTVNLAESIYFTKINRKRAKHALFLF